MSQADISVLTKLILDASQYAAELDAAEAKTRKAIESLGEGPGITIGVGVDLAKAEEDLYGFIRAYNETPIIIQVSADMSRANEQLAEFAQRGGLPPISIPGPTYGADGPAAPPTPPPSPGPSDVRMPASPELPTVEAVPAVPAEVPASAVASTIENQLGPAEAPSVAVSEPAEPVAPTPPVVPEPAQQPVAAVPAAPVPPVPVGFTTARGEAFSYDAETGSSTLTNPGPKVIATPSDDTMYVDPFDANQLRSFATSSGRPTRIEPLDDGTMRRLTLNPQEDGSQSWQESDFHAQRHIPYTREPSEGKSVVQAYRDEGTDPESNLYDRWNVGGRVDAVTMSGPPLPPAPVEAEASPAASTAIAAEATSAESAAASARELVEAQRQAASALNQLADEVRSSTAAAKEPVTAADLTKGTGQPPVPTPAPAPAQAATAAAEAEIVPVAPAAPVAEAEASTAQAEAGATAVAGSDAASTVVSEAAAAYAEALGAAAATLTTSAAAVEASMTAAAGAGDAMAVEMTAASASATAIVPALDAIAAASGLLAAAEDAAVAALSPIVTAAAAMRTATGAMTAELQTSIAGIQQMDQASTAAQGALSQLAAAARQAAGNVGNAPSGGGGPGGAGTFATVNPTTGQPVPLSFDPVGRQFINAQNGMGVAGVNWPGFDATGGGNGGPGGNGGNGNNGGGRPGGRGRGHGLGRMLGAFYIANEIHRVANTESEYDNESDLAGNDQQAQFKASEKEVRSLQGGIFGMVAGETIDPGGHYLSAASDMAKGAEDSVQRDDDVRAGMRHSRELDIEKDLAQAGSRPEERRAEKEKRDNDESEVLRKDDEDAAKKKRDAAKARDDARAAAQQVHSAERWHAAELAGGTFGLGAGKANSWNAESDKKRDDALKAADDTYNSFVDQFEKQRQHDRADHTAKFDAQERRVKQKEQTEDEVTVESDAIDRAGLTDDRFTERVAKKKTEVLSHAQKLRDEHRDDEADRYMNEVGDPSIAREQRIAATDEGNRHRAAARRAEDLEGEADDIGKRRAGESDAAELDAFKRRGQDRIAEAQDKLKTVTATGNQSDIADATRNVEATKKDVAAEDGEKDEEVRRRRDASNAEAATRVKDIEVDAEASAAAAKGDLYDADTIRFKRAQDDKVEHLKAKLAETVDAQQRTNIQAEIKATENANGAASGARDAAHVREDTEHREDIEERTRETDLRDKGQDFAAEQHRIQFEAERDFRRLKEEGASPETIKAREKEHDADVRSADDREKKHYDSVRDGAADTLLRASGRGDVADLIDIQRDVAQQERAIDPKSANAAKEMADVKASGLARVAAVQESLKGQASFGLSNEQYYEQLNEKAVAGRHTQEALDKAKNLTNDINGSGTGNPLAAPDLKEALGHLTDSSANLRDAAKFLTENTEKLYVAQ